MNNPTPEPLQPHHYDRDEQVAAAERRRLARIADDLLTAPVDFYDSQVPRDGVSVVRSGPRGGASSYVSLLNIEGPQSAVVSLRASDARRLAATLLDLADQIDSPAEQIKRAHA